MSPIQILKLVGFATGAMLHLYIAWLIWSRRLGTQQSQSQPARLITVLNLCLGVWFLGNLFITLHELLLGRERLTFLLRAWDVLATTGVALLPAALLHAHVAMWASLDGYRTLTRRSVRLVGAALYVPMAFLPYAVYRLTTGDYRPFMLKIRVLLIPYAIWYLLVMISSALIDWAIVKKLARDAERERTFFKRLGVLLILNGAFQFYVVAIARSGPSDFLWVTFILLSLLPIFFVAYHVYRYRIVDVAVRDSLVYAVFALVFIAVYTYGVRRLDQFLVARFDITPGVVEVILLLGMVALAGPLVRVIDRAVHQLFTGEIGLYRDVVRQVATGAEGFGELAAFVRYSEETIRRGLELESVRIVTVEAAAPDSHERRLIDKLEAWGAESVETDEDLKAIGAAIAYALRREGRIIGLMIIAADPSALTSEKRSVLDVIAGQVAVEVEGCRLIEEKVRLERELAARERLATLGQMAAQVAHEVKNPLSAIKSIAQVMREEEALKDYDRDLELIVSEIDRLNRTVSQLLAFSRPSRADQRAVALVGLIDSTVALITSEAKEQGVSVMTELTDAVTLPGTQAGALREALSNLVINAVQAMDGGGKVTIQARVETVRKARQEAAQLVLTVTDTGPGIALEAQQKVFEPFYSTKSRGTGLGLAIVQRRAVEMGGVVELISPVADGRGTQFRLIVPLSTAVPQL
ncbi:MAG: two-component system sensor histidine kinase NtrB [Blastocatellia bacterium]